MAEMIDAIHDKRRPHLGKRIEIVAVIASKLGIEGIDKARARDIPDKDIVVIDPGDYRGPDGEKSQDLFGNRLAEELRAREVTVFTQNGWLPTTPVMVALGWRGYNQHPGDPRDFGGIYGKQVHAAALHFSDQLERDVPTFAVAQEVSPQVDGGAIVLYESIMMPKPTLEDKALVGEEAEERFKQRVGELQQTVLPREHAIQVMLLERIALRNVERIGMPRVVFPGEEGIRDRAKELAVQRFPHG